MANIIFRMKYICRIFIISSFFFSGISADSASVQDIRGKAMGNTGVASESLSNPAGISFFENPTVIIGYENQFNIKELVEFSAGFAFPNSLLDGSISLSRFGYEHYNENLLHVTFSKKLFHRFSLGISLNYFFFQTSENSDNPWKLTSDVGLIWKIHRDLSLGMTFSNFILTESDESRPFRQAFQIGLSYFIAPKVELCLEYDKMFNDTPFYKIGIDYQIIDGLFFRAGYFGKPFLPTGGLGYRFKKCRFDLSADNHPYLGLSTSIGLSYFFE